MTVSELATLIASGGGGAVLLALVTGIIKWVSGASHREREKNTNLVTQRRDAIEDRNRAEDERDDADQRRREAEEHVSILKRQLREHGIEPLERPDKEKND